MPARKPASTRKRTAPKTAAQKKRSAKRAAQKTAVAHRRMEVAALAKAYVPQSAIARQLGVSEATISADLKAIREAWLEEAKIEIQSAAIVELQSIDRLEQQLWTQFLAKTLSPDQRTRTAAQILKCKERRARMLGFDQPELLEVKITHEMVEQEIRRLEEQLGYTGPKALPA